MRRLRAAASLLLTFTSCVFAAQTSKPAKPHSPSKSPGERIPGAKVITSFDTDHTVIGWLEIIPFESKIFHNTRMLRVLLPANYLSPHNAHRSYPVLYMQDGQSLFDTATSGVGSEWHMDETVEHLVGSFKIPPMLIVGIDNAGEQRSAEYLPYPDNQNNKASEAKDVHGKDYERFLLTEVMPFIEKNYRVTRGAANTGIGGSSYGADISLYIALQHPATFGHVLVESPPLWIGDNQLLRDAERAKLLPQKVYLGVGTKEAPYGDSLQSPKVVDQAKELEKILRKKGMGPTRLTLVVEEGAEHNADAWSRRLPEAMLFLYGK